ncbi:inorganic phosphate transporter [Scopulibacillus cellulosilyticus]|uniref:Anion permease n=1 Tax=Scopulibacillus cellulosilyticus TaxID=2665665 RepID=A0ABW2Q2G1_9BACL
MDNILYLIILVVILGLAFDFINGFHDTANTVATSISTRALHPRAAIILAGAMNLIGALMFTGVAQTISKGIVDPFSLNNGLMVVLAALIAAIIWNLLTWYFGIPSSSSHAIIGSIAGAAIASEGFGSLNYKGFLNIIEALVVSPILALAVGLIIMTLFKIIFKNFPLSKTNQGFRTLQIFTAALQSLSHGTNDAQKTMGIITMALIAAGYHSSPDIPLWVRIIAALTMAAGTSVGGWRIIKTVGGKIMKLRPVNGAAADLSSTIIIFGFSKLGLPVSTTHVISSSIMGVGSAQRIRGVDWGVALRIIFTWIITLPITAILAAIVFKIIMLFV